MKTFSLLLIVAALITFNACTRTARVEYVDRWHTAVDVRHVVDSVFHVEHDSVYIWQAPDTFVKEVWRIRYRDVIRVDTLHKVDTLRLCEVREVEKVKKSPQSLFWGVLVGFCAALVLFIVLLIKRR